MEFVKDTIIYTQTSINENKIINNEESTLNMSVHNPTKTTNGINEHLKGSLNSTENKEGVEKVKEKHLNKEKVPIKREHIIKNKILINTYTTNNRRKSSSKDSEELQCINIIRNKEKHYAVKRQNNTEVITAKPNTTNKSFDVSNQTIGSSRFKRINKEKNVLYKKYNIIVEEDINIPIVNIDNINNNDAECTNNNQNLLLDNLLDKEKTNQINSETDITDSKPDDSDITLDINSQEWLNLDEFKSIIKELNSASSTDLCDIEDVIEKYTIDKKINSNTSVIDEIGTCNENVKSNNNFNAKTINITEADVICISSDEEIDLPLTIPLEDLDNISWSSIEALCDDGDILDSKAKNLNSKIINESIENIQLNGAEDDIKETQDVKPIIADLNSAPKDKENERYIVKDTLVDDIKIVNKNANDVKKTDVNTNPLSSNDSVNDNLDDSLCSGYSSSDFEFISEDEAKKHGFIINYLKKRDSCENEIKTFKTLEMTRELEQNSSNNSQNLDNMPGSSRQGVTSRVESPKFIGDPNYRHDIPDGDRFLNLFEGHYAPSIPYMYEDKSMGSLREPNYDGLGFDIRELQQVADDDEYKEDAEESRQKILKMYPGENRKRRRRF